MKQSFLLTLVLSLLLSASISRATILPIAKGDGIWNVATRIASELATISLAGLAGTCNFPITQSDVGSGGTFVITASNAIYCLDGNIVTNTGSAIRITGDGITLDLMGHIIDGQNFATTGIELAGGVKNITIRNGTIRRMGGTAPNGTAIRDTVNHTAPLKNIVIKDMNFSDNAVAAINFANAAAPTPDVDKFLIENCHAFNSGGIKVVANAGVVQDCEVDERRGGGIDGAIQVSGPAFATVAREFVIQDCTTTTSFAANNDEIFVGRAQDVLIRNCAVLGASVNGFNVSDCDKVVISDCTAQSRRASGNGFIVQNPLQSGALVIEESTATGYTTGFLITTGTGITGYATAFSATGTGLESSFTSVTVTGCVAEGNTSNGFLLFQTKPTPWRNIAFQKCCSTGNACGFVTGILFNGGTISQLSFEDCIAQHNNGDGFSLINTGDGYTIVGSNIIELPSAIDGVEFKNCISQSNRGGYDPITTTTFQGHGFGLGLQRSQNATIYLSNGPSFNAFIFTRYNVVTGFYTKPFNTGGAKPAAAFAPDGTFYTTDPGFFNPTLMRTNPISGASTAVGAPWGFGVSNSLAVSPEGIIYAMREQDLVTLDPNTGAATTLGTTPFSGNGGGLEFFNGNLYLATGQLIRINIANPALSQLVGPLAIGTSGLATLYINGEYQLWGASSATSGVNNFRIYRIDPATATIMYSQQLALGPLMAQGFSAASNVPFTGPIRNVIFENCISQGNIHDGFSCVSTTSNINFVDCFAMNNTGTGVRLSGTRTNNSFAIGDMATGNAFDFDGVSDPTLVIPYSTPGAINGIGRFVNVSS
jgi:hypothetical protein